MRLASLVTNTPNPQAAPPPNLNNQNFPGLPTPKFPEDTKGGDNAQAQTPSPGAASGGPSPGGVPNSNPNQPQSEVNDGERKLGGWAAAVLKRESEVRSGARLHGVNVRCRHFRTWDRCC